MFLCRSGAGRRGCGAGFCYADHEQKTFFSEEKKQKTLSCRACHAAKEQLPRCFPRLPEACRLPCARHANPRSASTVDRLAHVIDRQRGHAGGGQRLHLHAGAPGGAHGRADLHADASADNTRDTAIDRQRVTQRDQLGGALGGHDAGEARDAQHVALFRACRPHHAPGSRPASPPGARAVALRSVSGLPETSTIAALPGASKWVSGQLIRRAAPASPRPGRAGAAGSRPPAGNARPRRPGAAGRHGRVCRSRSPGCGRARRAGPGRSVVSMSVRSVFRLRLLMPISGVCSPSARSSSRAVMHLHQHVEVEVARHLLQLDRLRIAQRRHDQQDAIGPGGPALEDLPRVEDEILAQHRQVTAARAASGRRASPGNTGRRSAR